MHSARARFVTAGTRVRTHARTHAPASRAHCPSSERNSGCVSESATSYVTTAWLIDLCVPRAARAHGEPAPRAGRTGARRPRAHLGC
jgi:hypothetical protein